MTYDVRVTFAGIIGSDEIYTVDADSEEDAIAEAELLARDDLSYLEAVEVDEDEWEVTVGFANYVGVEETYTVTAESEEDACDLAIEEAVYDLDYEIDED